MRKLFDGSVSVLEWLDDSASAVVPLLYLVGLMIGTMAYFAGISWNIGVAVGLALSVAAELDSFLRQRRLRGLLARRSRGEKVAGLCSSFAILCALVSFSAYNSVAFVASHWTPASGWLPGPVQIGIRGLVVPLLFLASGSLTPLHTDAGTTLNRASTRMLRKAIRVTLSQWDARLQHAEKHGLPLDSLAVALFEDAGDKDGARRVQMIADGLAQAEAKASTPHMDTSTQAQNKPSTTPPTDVGTPVALPSGGVLTPGTNVLQMPRPQPRAKTSTRAGRAKQPASAEAKVRAAWQPGMGVRELEKAANIGRSTASKWHAILTQEDAQASETETLVAAR